MVLQIDERSEHLFGRYQAFRIALVVARSPKAEVASGRVASLAGVETGVVSKEFSRLVRLGVLRSVSRRGDYERTDQEFWTAIETLAEHWGY
jgi:hypothetical protein